MVMEEEVPTLQFEPALHAALQEAAWRQHVSLNRLVEMYCAQGLAHENESGPLREGQPAPALRALLEDVVAQRVERRRGPGRPPVKPDAPLDPPRRVRPSLPVPQRRAHRSRPRRRHRGAGGGGHRLVAGDQSG